ncbi:hypothetical protein HYW20_07215 [Candidatus Woesearchaeota archaeon]|nr:hypothetical protein [Candidatus Woesearchaeota archaeon]
MPKNIILNSLESAFALIWRNKLLFILLFILQIVFFVILSLIHYAYVPKMVESQKAIYDYMSSIKMDDISVASNVLGQKNLLGDDPLLISRNFNEIVRNFRLYMIYIFILLAFSISMFWAVTYKIIHKPSFKHVTRLFFRIFSVCIFYLGLIFAFFFSLLNISLAGVAAESSKLLTKYVPFLVISVVLTYFMFISLSLIYDTKLNNIVQKTLSIGIKKIHYLLSVYLINIFLFMLSIFLLYFFIERNLFVLLLSMLLMIFSFVFGRIFLANVVERLG